MKINNRRKITLAITLVITLAMTIGIVVFAQEWKSITGGIYQDPITGNFIFQTIDRKKSSDIYYRTQGFTIADAYKDGSGDIIETGLGEFVFPLNDPSVDYEEVTIKESESGKIIRTTWIIPQSTVMEKIAATSPAWYDKIVNPTGDVYLKLDAILAVQDKNSYDDPAGTGESWSGFLEEDGTYIGELWDKNNYGELYDKYGWDDSFFENHFKKALLLAFAEEEGDNNPVDGVPPSDELVKIIGKDNPEYKTYNKPVKDFEIGESYSNGGVVGGIPTSEDITNGYNADEWYGWAGVCRRRGATHSWKFSGTISWKGYIKVGEHYDEEQDCMVDDYVECTYNKPYSYTVERTVRYWYLNTCYFYDLDKVLDENEVFPGGSHLFTSGIETQITCTVNGEDLTKVTSVNYAPDDDYHVAWPEITKDKLKINISADSESAAAAAFDATAEGRVIPAKEIYVKNDELTINDKTYMSGEQYKYKEFKENAETDKSFYSIGDSDYGVEEDEETGTIPSYIANGVYGTSITATYKQVVLKSTTGKTWGPKTPENSSIADRIVEAFTKNEKIRVHTPTISPVIIEDPETGEELKKEDTKHQLVDEAINEYVNYQLLLDGTYTIRFIPEQHAEHIGYPEMAEDLYNYYCKFKQCAFPFTVQIKDDKERDHLYTPDSSTTDSEGNAKLSGYTEWIDLANFEIDDFYIPSWAIEGNDYTIKFRVAPENVVDQYGVNHIDDTEWLLNNVLYNGEPIYNYVSTYDITAQLSGRIYDFQAVGINDKDMFGGLAEGGYSNGFGYLTQNYAFCPEKEEKRTGTKNRLGGDSVRYTLDGTLTNSWNLLNTLPFSNGRSRAIKEEGTLRKGDSFAFSVRTMANLWNEEGDYLVITPTFRYISKDGTVNRSVDVYSTITSVDGKERLYFVEYGSTIDTSNYNPCSISDLRFDGSYYTKDPLFNRNVQDDVTFSRKITNEWLYKKNVGTISTYPKNVYVNNNAYLRREDDCYCLSKIKLSSQLRLLTGNLEQLERNLSKQGSNLEYLMDVMVDEDGNEVQYPITENNSEIWKKFRKSMQTWYGAYYIPNQLYITDDVFETDTDGDGVIEENEKYDTIWEYAEDKGYVEGNEDFIKKDGYLVINFDIKTRKNGDPHLTYYGSNADQWQIEGAPDKVKVGDDDFGEEIEVSVESGDVAIVDLEKSTTDGYYVGYNRIN